MGHMWKTAIACLLVLALLAIPALGCGEDGGVAKVSIKAGYITDLTGPIASVMTPHYYAYHDVARYLNENDPIPGAKFEVLTYDTQMNAARFIPGYEWVKERGAKLVLSPMPQASEVLIPFLAQDKIPNFSPTCSAPMLESEWTYSVGLPANEQWWGPMKWIMDNWDYSNGKPKIGLVGYATDYEWDVVRSVEEWVAAYPDKFDYVGDFLAPFGQVTWFAQVEALKDCDWVGPCHGFGTGQSTFIKEFRNRGCTARFFSGEAMPCWVNLIIDSTSWEAVDGSIAHIGWPWWSDTDYACVQTCIDLLTENHPGEADEVMFAGIGYIAAFFQMYFVYQLVKATAAEVGPENVDGQAIKDMAVNFSYPFEGIPTLEFKAGDRVAIHSGADYEWKADKANLIRISDWYEVKLP